MKLYGEPSEALWKHGVDTEGCVCVHVYVDKITPVAWREA